MKTDQLQRGTKLGSTRLGIQPLFISNALGVLLQELLFATRQRVFARGMDFFKDAVGFLGLEFMVAQRRVVQGMKLELAPFPPSLNRLDPLAGILQLGETPTEEKVRVAKRIPSRCTS